MLTLLALFVPAHAAEAQCSLDVCDLCIVNDAPDCTPTEDVTNLVVDGPGVVVLRIEDGATYTLETLEVRGGATLLLELVAGTELVIEELLVTGPTTSATLGGPPGGGLTIHSDEADRRSVTVDLGATLTLDHVDVSSSAVGTDWECGGAILVHGGGILGMNNGHVTGGEATFGGGLCVQGGGSEATVSGTSFAGNGFHPIPPAVPYLGGRDVTARNGATLILDGTIHSGPSSDTSTLPPAPFYKGGSIFVENGATALIGATTPVTITDFAAHHGGGVYLNGCSPSMVNVHVFSTAGAAGGGGVEVVDCDATVAGIFSETVSNESGGGLLVTGASTVDVQDAYFERTEANWGGGAIAQTDATVNVRSSYVYDTSAAFGAAFNSEGDGELNLDSVVLCDVGASTWSMSLSSTTTIKRSWIEASGPIWAVAGTDIDLEQVTVLAPLDGIFDNVDGSVKQSILEVDPDEATSQWDTSILYVDPDDWLPGTPSLLGGPPGGPVLCSLNVRGPHLTWAPEALPEGPGDFAQVWGALGSWDPSIEQHTLPVRASDGTLSFPAWHQDEDDDGFVLGLDCDDMEFDTDGIIHPGAEETCDDVDHDCNGQVGNVQTVWEDDPPVTAPIWYPDVDGDGAGDPDGAAQACTTYGLETLDEGEWVLNGDDCNDADDEVFSRTLYRIDYDRDGFPGEDTVLLCESEVATWVPDTDPFGAPVLIDDPAVEPDCDDLDPAVFPQQGYVDEDGDGHGGQVPLFGCGASWSDVGDDCDDGDDARFPGAKEFCNGVDNDCDPATPHQQLEWYRDGDADGVGAGDPILACLAPGSDWVTEGDDCNDQEETIYPGAPEICGNGVDEDCDFEDDDLDDAILQWADDDDDGYGDADREAMPTCPGTPGWVPNDLDCNDGDDAIYPDAPEVCGNEVDEDCDGLQDDLDGAVPQWADLDGDGFGAEGESELVCPGTDEWAPNDLDCNDDDPDIAERIDQWRDEDDDKFGAQDTPSTATCRGTRGWVPNDLDCDDTDPTANPDGVEIIDNGIDEDCSGSDRQSYIAGGCSTTTPRASWSSWLGRRR